MLLIKFNLIGWGYRIIMKTFNCVQSWKPSPFQLLFYSLRNEPVPTADTPLSHLQSDSQGTDLISWQDDIWLNAAVTALYCQRVVFWLEGVNRLWSAHGTVYVALDVMSLFWCDLICGWHIICKLIVIVFVIYFGVRPFLRATNHFISVST
jgi:hypothetical protein